MLSNAVRFGVHRKEFVTEIEEWAAEIRKDGWSDNDELPDYQWTVLTNKIINVASRLSTVKKN